jgi:PPK2 family polyphosphate:nucleotide phosphotransferase
MSRERWLVPPGVRAALADRHPDDIAPFARRKEAREVMAADLERLRDLQERLYVDGRYAVLLVLQGMDTAGKDGMIRHLSSAIDLAGAEVTSFKTPHSAELRQDFLWRIHQRAPARGRIGIFNRSHYEDVIVVRVKNLAPPPVWERRYEHINAFERLLVDSDTVVIKCFLYISKEEQRERLEARRTTPEKLWKLTPSDITERRFWDDYMAAYEDALTRCSTEHAPWFVIPANNKWFRNYAITRLMVEALEGLDLKLPEPTVDPESVVIE